MSEIHYSEGWYASSRLSDTIIRDKLGEYWYIYSVEESGKVSCVDLCGKDSLPVNKNLEDFSFMPFELGYTNNFDSSFYWCRLAQRHYKQGVNNVNSILLANGTNKTCNLNTTSDMCKNTLRNFYPSFELSCDFVLSGHKKSSAFCKDFAVALGKNKGFLKVYYRSVEVGEFAVMTDYSNLVLNMNKGVEYLKKNLEKHCYGK